MQPLFAGLLLAACTATEEPSDGGTVKVPPGKDPPTVPDTDESTSTTESIATADTGTTPTTPDPCDPLPPVPTTWDSVSVPTSEEFTFDDQGDLLNINSSGLLMRTTRAGTSTPVAPFGGGDLAGVRMLLDGDLAIADEWSGTVYRMSVTTGATAPIVSGLPSPNSLTVDTRGWLYVASFGMLVRVDPANPGPPEVLANVPNADLDGLTFSPDFSRLYVNYDSGGIVGYVEFDASMNRLGMNTLASIPGNAELDGMATDACGNVYVIVTNGQVWRVRPTGEVQPFVQLGPGSPWTTSLNFGSGVGGWERDHLYVMNRSGAMFDLDIGIEGRWEPHLPVP